MTPAYVTWERQRMLAVEAAGHATGGDYLATAELYGPVLQGEGPHAGRPTTFLRLMGCNLSCAWCDSAFTWDPTAPGFREGAERLAAHEILSRFAGTGAPTLTISGGEPMLQARRPAFARVVGGVHELGRDVHMETNGTVPPGRLVSLLDAVAVSPKGPNAGAHRGRQDPAVHPDWLAAAQHHPGVFFKLVVESAAEVREWAADLVAAGVPRARLWMMPQGRTAAEIGGRWAEVMDAAAAEGVNATTRLHVLAHGEERGR